MKDCKHKLTTMPSGKEICQKCGLDFTSIKIKDLEAENERLKGANKRYNKLAKVIESNIAVFNGITHKQFKKKTLSEINKLKCNMPDYYVTDVCANCETNASEFEERMCRLSRRNIEQTAELTALESQLAKHEWRSVEDGPKVSGEYLVEVEHAKIKNVSYVTVDMYSTVDSMWGSSNNHIRWMPIPDLPEPKKEGE